MLVLKFPQFEFLNTTEITHLNKSSLVSQGDSKGSYKRTLRSKSLRSTVLILTWEGDGQSEGSRWITGPDLLALVSFPKSEDQVR